jgi:hypothetical protein
LIALPAVYWAIRLNWKIKENGFLFFGLLLLFLNGLGSFFFHAFRSSSLFLVMDVLPAAMLTLSIMIYFWWQLIKKWWMIPLVILPAFLFRWAIWQVPDEHLAINLSYALTGILILLPVGLILRKTAYKNWNLIALTIFFLSLALYFRQVDPVSGRYLSTGTHFLWHALSGAGGFTLFQYLHLYKTDTIYGHKK